MLEDKVYGFRTPSDLTLERLRQKFPGRLEKRPERGDTMTYSEFDKEWRG